MAFFQETEKKCDLILHTKSARGCFLLLVCIYVNLYIALYNILQPVVTNNPHTFTV